MLCKVVNDAQAAVKGAEQTGEYLELRFQTVRQVEPSDCCIQVLH